MLYCCTHLILYPCHKWLSVLCMPPWQTYVRPDTSMHGQHSINLICILTKQEQPKCCSGEVTCMRWWAKGQHCKDVHKAGWQRDNSTCLACSSLLAWVRTAPHTEQQQVVQELMETEWCINISKATVTTCNNGCMCTGVLSATDQCNYCKELPTRQAPSLVVNVSEYVCTSAISISAIWSRTMISFGIMGWAWSLLVHPPNCCHSLC